MFERFTGRARQVVVLAQEEARMLDHNYIGTEHLLLALLRGGGIAASALESAGVSVEGARQQIEEIIGRGPQAPPGHIPFTPRAKKVLELALREALQLGHNYIGTEHILLGLIREGEGMAAQVIVRLGADLGRVRQQVIELVDGGHTEDNPRDRRSGAQAGRGRRKRVARVEDRLAALESRLSALEHRVGGPPDAGDVPDVRELDREVAQTGRDKESAIDAQDFQRAAVLRDRELELLRERAAREQEWAATRDNLPSLSDEVAEIRGLLRRHGIDPQDGAA